MSHIWLGAVQGFAGVSVHNGELHVTPSLPRQWQRLAFPFCWQGGTLSFAMTHDTLTMTSTRAVRLFINGLAIDVDGETVFHRDGNVWRKEALCNPTR
ncbi:glycosyl hydrolase family 65 protein [Cronobacter dublinensis]|uniref:glycosyl hydrolase family 65 protein n=1 Tax=Cronobacter dublinensis TaxID=413497 RepID=UPI001F387F1C|nr:glycosyl hydrolase family 65 protein [Cronobacter dublinensis]